MIWLKSIMVTCFIQNTGTMEKVFQPSKHELFQIKFFTENYFSPIRDYSSENLRWLTTELALEDIANFIAYQKSLPEFNTSKVVVIGGSYSATLATWMRLKFPHLVDIAYSSSAPLEAIVDFYRK